MADRIGKTWMTRRKLVKGTAAASTVVASEQVVTRAQGATPEAVAPGSVDADATPVAATRQEQLDAATQMPDGTFLTTSDGVRVSTADDTLKAGTRGPSLIQDFHFQEKLAHFDRERIPERVVHARGSGAHGEFELYESLADITAAAFLQDPAVKTPVFCRFSTVAGFRGSADTVRDVRGFSVKFYTTEGNYDLIGNNMPVFFIQDAMKFPDFVHAVKPEQDNQMPQAASAHDTFWDFINLQPEATHMVMWAMSDRGIPRQFSTMEGFGVHTFIMTNAEGVGHFVKFHWKPVNGLRSNVWDEQQKIAGKNGDFNRSGLWESIEMGNFPAWELGLQVVPMEDEFSFDFDLLDPTKLIPEELVPVRIVGKMTLNRNPDNFFAETEQIALHPGRFVPGIGPSNDPLLQGRMFSYLDTQFHRLGGANFNQLPINRPVAEVHTNEREGQHQSMIHTGKGSYFPNSVAGGYPTVATPEEGAYVHYPETVEGEKLAQRAESFKEHFSQATLFWNSLTDGEKQHEVDAFAFELSMVKDAGIRERVVAQFNKVDNDLASRIAASLGLEAPAPEVENHGRSSDALSIDKRERTSIKPFKIAMLVANGYDSTGLAVFADAIMAEGASVELIGQAVTGVTDLDGALAPLKFTMKNAHPVLFDALIVAGGEQAVTMLAGIPDTMDWIKEMFRHNKPIAILGEASTLLEAAALPGVEGAPASDVDEAMGLLVTDGTDADAPNRYVQMLYQGRFWNREGATSDPIV